MLGAACSNVEGTRCRGRFSLVINSPDRVLVTTVSWMHKDAQDIDSCEVFISSGRLQGSVSGRPLMGKIMFDKHPEKPSGRSSDWCHSWLVDS